MKRAAWLGFVVVLAGCGSKPAPAPDGPAYPPLAKHADSRVVVVEAATGRRVILYPPANGGKAKGLVVIGAAGSNLVTGMALSEGDRPEHLPFAQAGYAVAAYDIAGPMPPMPPEGVDASLVGNAIDEFVAHGCGIADGQTAIDLGLAEFPEAAENVIAAGHSSAATLALALTAHEPRVKRCIAFAPVTDVLAFLGPKRLDSIRKTPDLFAAVARNSPVALTPQLKKPIFLFVAEDDANVPAAQVKEFAEALRANEAAVTLASVKTGGHYDAMLQEGHSRALTWLGTKDASSGSRRLK